MHLNSNGFPIFMGNKTILRETIIIVGSDCKIYKFKSFSQTAGESQGKKDIARSKIPS